MDIPTKVTLEITADAYTRTVYAGKKKLSERTCRMESAGSARGTRTGDVFDDITDDGLQDFAEAVDALDGFDIAGKLYDLASLQKTMNTPKNATGGCCPPAPCSALCQHCGGPIAVRNPTGQCDHLYWPDNLTDEAKRDNGFRLVTRQSWKRETGA